jgi:hypothetical protein
VLCCRLVSTCHPRPGQALRVSGWIASSPSREPIQGLAAHPGCACRAFQAGVALHAGKPTHTVAASRYGAPSPRPPQLAAPSWTHTNPRPAAPSRRLESRGASSATTSPRHSRPLAAVAAAEGRALLPRPLVFRLGPASSPDRAPGARSSQEPNPPGTRLARPGEGRRRAVGSHGNDCIGTPPSAPAAPAPDRVAAGTGWRPAMAAPRPRAIDGARPARPAGRSR